VGCAECTLRGYLDGEALIDRAAAERFEAMRGALPEELVVPRLVTSDPDEARRWVSGA
jgi:hypothetical protein